MLNIYVTIGSRLFFSVPQDRDHQVHNFPKHVIPHVEWYFNKTFVEEKSLWALLMLLYPCSLELLIGLEWGIPGYQVKSLASYLPPVFLVSSPTLTMQQIILLLFLDQYFWMNRVLKSFL